MGKSLAPIRIALIFTALIIFSGQAIAQSARPKATPKPKATPAKAAPAQSKTASSLSALETEIFNEINLLRANPAAYAKYLEPMRSGFKGTVLTMADGEQLITNEGVAGINDAIAYLKTARSSPAFKLSPGLTAAAADHLRDLIKNSLSGHKGSDGSWPPDRVDRYGKWSGEVKENISYHAISARDIVINMLIDDGNPKRDHRKNLLSADLKSIGLSGGDSKTYGRVAVIVFAVGFAEKHSLK